MGEKELKVAALRNGTVIDHIPADKLFSVVSILRLKHSSHPLTIGNNFESKKISSKGIIKISDKILEEDEANKIALLAPSVKVNIVREYQVVEKRILQLPDEVTDIVSCNNPNCITNHQPVTTKFYVIKEESTYRLKCRYCEREINQNEVNLIKTK